MRFAIHHPAFKSQRLSVQTALGLGGPKLLLNDEIVKRQYGTYPMLSDSGSQFLAQMDVNWVDTIPVVKIGGKSISVAKPLRWFEYAWICLPLLLVFVGGCLASSWDGDRRSLVLGFSEATARRARSTCWRPLARSWALQSFLLSRP
jgi:hypothetical protein